MLRGTARKLNKNNKSVKKEIKVREGTIVLNRVVRDASSRS